MKSLLKKMTTKCFGTMFAPLFLPKQGCLNSYYWGEDQSLIYFIKFINLSSQFKPADTKDLKSFGLHINETDFVVFCRLAKIKILQR